MNRARKKENIGSVVWAHEVDPNDLPEKGLLCGNFACASKNNPPEVCYKPAVKTHGGLYPRVASFATLGGQLDRHDESCPLVSRDSAKAYRSLEQAIDAGKFILLNLNLALPKGSPSFPDDNEYNQWRAENRGNYHAISVSSLDQYLSIYDILSEKKYIDRTKVGHLGHIRDLSYFHIDDDKNQMKDLYLGLESEDEVVYSDRDKDYEDGFVRFIKFTPTGNTRNGNAKDDKIRGNAVFYGRNKNLKALILNQLRFDMEEDKGEEPINQSAFLNHDAYLIAIPQVKRTEVLDIQVAFNDASGRKPLWPTVYYTIFSNDQFAFIPSSDPKISKG